MTGRSDYWTMAGWSEDDSRPPSGWPLRRQVLVLLSGVLVLVVGAAVALSITVVQLRQVQAQQRHQLLPGAVEMERALSLFVDQQTGIRGYLITGDSAFLQPYRRATKDLPPLVANLRRQTAGLPLVPAELDRVVRAHDTWLRSAADPQLAAAMAGDRARAMAIVHASRHAGYFTALRDSVATAQNQILKLDARAAQRSQMLADRLTGLLVGSLVLLAILVIALAVILVREVLAPLARVRRSARVVAGGELELPVVTFGALEFRQLGADVEAMRRRLVAEVDTARVASEALDQRGPAVVALRSALTPRLTGVAGVELAGRLDPAEGVLAGDFYDTVRLADGRLGVLLGDVSGHGPGPAVFALQLKERLVADLDGGRSPGESLSWTARQHLVDVPDDQFATVFAAVVDVRAGTLSYANAGHPAALIVSMSGDEYLDPPGRGSVGGRVPMVGISWSCRRPGRCCRRW